MGILMPTATVGTQWHHILEQPFFNKISNSICNWGIKISHDCNDIAAFWVNFIPTMAKLNLVSRVFGTKKL